MRKYLITILFVICFTVASLSQIIMIFKSADSIPIGDVELNDVMTITLTASQATYGYDNIMDCSVAISGDSGDANGYSRTVYAYMDSTTRWKWRFRPEKLGRYTWSCTSSDAGPNGDSGTIRCLVDSGRTEKIVIDNTYHLKEEYSGDAFFWLGNTHWRAWFDDDSDGEETTDAEWDSLIAHWDDQDWWTVFQMSLMHTGDATRTMNGDYCFDMDGGDYDLDGTVDPNNEVWDGLDERIEDLHNAEIIPALAVTFAGDNNFFSTYDLDDEERLYDYVMARYGAYRPFWLCFGQYDDDGVAADWENAVAEFKSDPWDNLVTLHPMATVNPPIDESAHLDMTMLQDFGTPESIADALQSIRSSESLLTINGEFGYECNSGGDCKTNDQIAINVLEDAWAGCFTGCYMTYGQRQVWYNGDYDSTATLGASYMQYFYDYFTSFDWSDADTYGEDGVGDVDWYDFKDSGVFHAVYFENDIGAVSFDFSHLSASVDGGRWYNCTTGTWGGYQSFGNSASESLNPPDDDYAFLILDTS